jgi:D-alanine-D-alanine ligase
MKSSSARLFVAYNDDVDLKPHLNDIEKIGEAESGEAAREIAELLGAELCPVRDVREALRKLQHADVVVNLCEGVLGNPRFEMHFALALEMLGIPFTGADPIAVGICSDKKLVKRLLASCGITMPGDGFPAIVKPSREDAGVGIDRASVVATREEAEARARFIETTYRQPALIEEFIDGREFNQAMYLGKLLPPGEIVFADELAAEERIVGWKAKWANGSPEDRATVNRTPAVMDDTLRRDLADLCRKAARVLSIRGYCRMDIRQRPTGELCIVDINPNPDIGPQSGFRKALAAAGIGFRDFLEELMMSAMSRGSRRTA